jgi:hypothetical protein
MYSLSGLYRGFRHENHHRVLAGLYRAGAVLGLSGLLKAESGSQRLIRSLTLRVGLSIGLFMLLLGALFGWWRPQQAG